MILFGFSIGYWFQRNKNSNTGQTESQTKLKENTKETGETYTGITSEEETETADTDPEESQTESVTEGTEEYRGFVIDNVLQSEKEGDIHYNVYIPESYDGTKAYALYFTLPGYEGLYFQGVAANIRSEDFGFEAQKYNSEMIIVAPQLNDWGETSADQTIALVEYFLEHYNIDQESVCKWLFRWWGNDEYYGSEPTIQAYQTLHDLYEKQGLTEQEIDKLLVLDVKEHSYFTERNAPNEHGGGGFFAYDEEIMGWLFSQERSDSL